jgi:hypothetical protein
MSAIKSLIIHNIEAEYTSEYIANILWKHYIAQVKHITLIPQLTGNTILQTAYVEIEMWCDSEIAYNFIHRLNSGSKEARLVHRIDDWWKVEINTNKTIQLYLYAQTHHFPNSYFHKETNMENNMEKIIENTIRNSKYVTLRPHQKIYKQQESFMV